MQIVNKKILAQLKDVVLGTEKEVVELKNGYGVNVIQLSAMGAVTLSVLTQDSQDEAMYIWVAACCVDEDHNPVFTHEDVKKLPASMFSKLSEVVMRLNGLLNNETVESAEKNSEEVES